VAERAQDFRNPNSVAHKSFDLATVHPEYSGVPRMNAAAKRVVAAFLDKPTEMHAEAQVLRAFENVRFGLPLDAVDRINELVNSHVSEPELLFSAAAADCLPNDLSAGARYPATGHCYPQILRLHLVLRLLRADYVAYPRVKVTASLLRYLWSKVSHAFCSGSPSWLVSHDCASSNEEYGTSAECAWLLAREAGQKPASAARQESG
jgi:hypothetical protein